MKKRYWLVAVLLCCILLLLAGCSRSDTQQEVATTGPEETTGIAEPAAADASLNSLRQAMVGTPQVFAVA